MLFLYLPETCCMSILYLLIEHKNADIRAEAENFPDLIILAASTTGFESVRIRVGRFDSTINGAHFFTAVATPKASLSHGNQSFW